MGGEDKNGKPGEKKERVVILDDIVTSLDIANRSILVKYLVEHFDKANCQIIVLTHNVAFYNFVSYYVNEFSKNGNRWHKCGLYLSGIDAKCLDNPKKGTKEIEDTLSKHPNDPNVGNDMRQLFEEYLFKLCNILQVGPFLESQKLIDDIYCHKPVYLLESGDNIYNMVTQIKSLIDDVPEELLKSKLNQLFNKYGENNQYNLLYDTIDKLKMYQKLSLHQNSHGHPGLTYDSQREKWTSLYLLKKMESIINNYEMKNVYSM